MTRHFNAWLGAFLVLIGIPFYWYFIDAGGGNLPPKPVTMTQLREIAAQIEGEAPEAIRYESVAEREVSANLLAAGDGIRPVPAILRLYQVMYPDGTYATIADGRDAGERRRLGFEPTDRAVEARVSRLLTGASARYSLGDRPPESSDGSLGENPLGIRALAPGIVSIPVGRPAGGQMLYVRLKNGAEFLFAGDVARVAENWASGHPPARILTSLYQPQDRDELLSWQRTIARLKRAARRLVIVEGHDPRAVEAATEGFSEHAVRKEPSGNARNNAVMAPQESRS